MYLFFIDESGDPGIKSTAGNLLVIGGLIIDSKDWQYYEQKLIQIKRGYKIDQSNEVKWEHVMMPDEDIARLKNKKNNPLYRYKFRDRIRYAEDILSVVADDVPCYVFSYICDKNKFVKNFPEFSHPTELYCASIIDALEKFHEFLIANNDWGLIIKDERSSTEDEIMMSMYDFIVNRSIFKKNPNKRFIENILMMPSDYSVGLQYADFCIAAIFQKFARSRDNLFNLILRKTKDPKTALDLIRVG